jgi:hypothetical protein
MVASGQGRVNALKSKKTTNLQKISTKPRHLRLIKSEDLPVIDPIPSVQPKLARPLINFLTQLADSIDQEVDSLSKL